MQHHNGHEHIKRPNKFTSKGFTINTKKLKSDQATNRKYSTKRQQNKSFFFKLFFEESFRERKLFDTELVHAKEPNNWLRTLSKFKLST